MIKINDFKNKKGIQTTYKPLNINKTLHSREDFRNTINSKYDFKIKEEVNELVKKIDIYGKIFTAKPSYYNLEIYKSHIQSFLKFANSYSCKIKEIYGRKVDYKIVSTINSKLEALSKQVLKNETSRIDLLASINEIKGLLIDLFL